MLSVDVKCDNATVATNLSSTSSHVKSAITQRGFLAPSRDKSPGLREEEVGRGCETVPGHIHLRKPHLLSALLVTAMWVRPRVPERSLPASARAQKSEECKWEGSWMQEYGRGGRRDADPAEAAEVIYVGSCAPMSGCAPTGRSTPGAVRQEMNTCFHHWPQAH